MKTALDPRHKRREKTVKTLFRLSFLEKDAIKGPLDALVQKIFDNQKKIDKAISRAAPEWPIAQINKIDLAILRLAIFELLICSREPARVIIDEAIELAKAYGSEKSPAFINGVLGTSLKYRTKNDKS